MKKLIFFGYTLDMGGAEKVLVNYINQLSKNYEIDLVLLQNKGELKKELSKNVEITEIRSNIIKYTLFRYIPLFRKYVINKIVNNKKYDVAIGFMEGRSATFVADIKKPIRKLAWIHNDVEKFDIGISKSEILSTYSKMDKIVTVSEYSKDTFCKKYGFNEDKVDVLYNMIDEESIIKKAEESVEKNNVFTFVNVGRMRPQKRQDRLVEIAKHLKDNGYTFQIQIIGDGPEEEKIKYLISEYDVSDKVKLLGLQLNPYPYIKNADCIVVSSDFEGYSVAIKEALLLKKVIISTYVSGVKEMFEDGKYGIICETTTEDLERKMQDLLDGKIDINRIKTNLEGFDCGNNKILSKLIDLIEGK